MTAKNPTEPTHLLVPMHAKLSDKEKTEILQHYNITIKELPKMIVNDPALATLGVKQGDVIKIVRRSPTAGETVFYRGVLDA